MNNFESILQALIENIDTGIHIVDRQGKTIYYNDAMGLMEGYDRKEVLGKSVAEYLGDVAEENSTLMNALNKDQKFTDVVQHYNSIHKKKIASINTTIPVKAKGQVIAAIEIAKDMTQLKELAEKLCELQLEGRDNRKHFNFNDIYGTSQAMQKAIETAKRASLSNSSVLIYSETGCGKEVFSQSIHYNGIRSNKPFIPINCAAIPDALLESMLFGTAKGSFTGSENKKGLFEEANGGTILLDEVNSMQPYLQSKLLRVLQDGYIRPIGSNKTVDVNVRIIATLNEEPEKLINNGILRKDLYYRLSVIRINIPPLRERKDDLQLYVDHFIGYYNELLLKNIEGVDTDVKEVFMNYDWPGNIRELKNVIESAMNMADGNTRVLSLEFFDGRIKGSKMNAINMDIKNYSLDEYIENIERHVIWKALKSNEFNISSTARELKISRQNLQYKIKKYKLDTK